MNTPHLCLVSCFHIWKSKEAFDIKVQIRLPKWVVSAALTNNIVECKPIIPVFGIILPQTIPIFTQKECSELFGHFNFLL